MQHLNGRGGKIAYDVTGNVVWLTHPRKHRGCRRVDAIDALKQSVTRLVGEIERSGRLKTDITAAIDVRRYELYRRSETLGAHASDRGLAAAQRIHVGSLLKFVYAIAAAGSDDRAGEPKPAARPDPLAKSIRELEASVMRARRLSQDVLTQCQRRDWREGASPRGQPRHRRSIVDERDGLGP